MKLLTCALLVFFKDSNLSLVFQPDFQQGDGEDIRGSIQRSSSCDSRISPGTPGDVPRGHKRSHVSRTNQPPNKAKHKQQKQKPNTKQKQKHPKRKIGIVNKASSVEKDVLCIMVESKHRAREQPGASRSPRDKFSRQWLPAKPRTGMSISHNFVFPPLPVRFSQSK